MFVAVITEYTAAVRLIRSGNPIFMFLSESDKKHGIVQEHEC